MELNQNNEQKKSKLPNEEQRLAIEHNGGKILSAGAGSGKTFVLIEHLVYLLEKLKSECPKTDWEVKIPAKLQRIVLMTFTVKAAGEMSSRMAIKIDEKIQNSQLVKNSMDVLFWSLIKKNLVYLKMTTISSFCLSLLKDEIKPVELPNVELVTHIEFKAKVTSLFAEWYEQHQSSLPFVIQSSADELIDSMISIFSSPEMRLTWHQQSKAKSIKDELSYFISESLATNSKEYWSGIDLSVDKKDQSKVWFQFLHSFVNLTKENGRLSSVNYKQYGEWARSISRAPAETKNIPDDLKHALSFAKDIRSWILEHEEHLIAFEDQNEKYHFWSKAFKSLFDFIEEKYLSIPGLVFADLEYYTYKSLLDLDNRQKVDQNYDYIIVDEFQDTSRIQFEILKKVTNDKWHKVFCVGDKKQAIYGFRGGELQVFNECVTQLGQENEIVLKNNFRSLKEVVHFNNSFFSYLFPLGIEYEGLDPHAIAMESQISGKAVLDQGEVYSLEAQIINNHDEKPDSIDSIEAKIIYEEIKKNLTDENIKTICILYRKLGPSEYLLKLFDQSFDFEIQIKVQLKEDPIVALFLLALELKMSQEDVNKKKRLYFLMDSTISAIGVQEVEHFVFDQYLQNTKIIPLVIAFENMLAALGLSNSLYKENLGIFHSISKICSGDTKKIYSLVYSESDQTFSYFIKTGISKKKIIIMTAHASKGLEFDQVIIGGSHTNGAYKGLDKIVGKWPESFKWKSNFTQKGFHKSLNYLLESQVNKNKDFSEAKRLLYVVCTRAIKKLCWVDLKCIVKGKQTDLSIAANSWINILRKASDLGCTKQIHVSDIDLNTIEQGGTTPSLVMRDFVGLNPKDHKVTIGLIVETSVTRLSQITVCPFKFYLAEICKIQPTKPDFVPLDSATNDHEEAEAVFYSSKSRGTKIHLELFNYFTTLNKEERGQLAKEDSLIWAKNEIEQLFGVDSKIYLERQMKFQLFGQMISGTPDACIVNANELVVIDYKTGRLDGDSLDSYWFQIYCYAYGMIKTKQFAPEKKIILILMYVDEQKSLTKTLTFAEVQDFLYDQWRKTECLAQVNNNHCLKCEYSNICQFAQV